MPVTRYLLLLAVGIASALADVAYSFEQRTTPRPLRIHVVRVELDSKQHTLDVIVAPDPDGPGPAEARLEKPGVLASQPDIVAAINANAFEEYPPPPHAPERRAHAPERFAGLERFHEQMAGYLTQEQPERAQQLLEETRRERP